MNDIFLMGREKITPDRIEIVAKKRGIYETRKGGDWIDVSYGDRSRDMWQFSSFGWEDVEEEEKNELVKDGVICMYCINYHLDSLRKLVNFLKVVLDEFDCWIGSDEDQFVPRYKRENAEDMFVDLS